MTQQNENIKSHEEFKELFAVIAINNENFVTKAQILDFFNRSGILAKDQRISDIIAILENNNNNDKIYFEEFIDITRSNFSILQKSVNEQLIIPEFETFKKEITKIFKKVKDNKSGNVASYIPQLARVCPDKYAMSICTIDGQKFNIGDSDEHFCIQSVCKPINYCIALELNGEDKVHNHIGREPSGRGFNEITLNRRSLPHNPMINAGAIMSCSLINPKDSLADRFDKVMSYWQDLSGSIKPGYNNSVYHSEKATADRNFALAYFMKELKSFPEGVNLYETLDFYFQCCSIEVNTNSMSNIAATLANSGICPNTDKKVFSPETVKHCLSLMYSCGMYDFSGEFAFSVGIPAKSGVAGGLMIVVPNLMGIAVWSPRLDEMGNTVRGVEFCKELVKTFNFHNYDSLIGASQKIDPRIKSNNKYINQIFSFIFAASQGDLKEVKHLIAHGADINSCDYDGRTAIHLASAEGEIDLVKFLIANNVNISVKDRWGNTPLDDAKANNHTEVIAILESILGKNKKDGALVNKGKKVAA
ncbi:MAG: glutaminase A [Rickettsiales bacterium]|jgi:glutaminase|nr:glutaminase A [Rickettsiales bacterium]